VRTRWMVLGLCLIIGVHVALALPNLDTAVDDAFISARYAAHLVDGHGLVFSAGEAPVEGYTNLAWVLFVALGLSLGVAPHPWMTQGGLFFGVWGLVFAAGLARALIGRTHIAILLAPALLALSPHYAVVVTNGLETGLFVCALLGACWALLATRGRQSLIAGVALGGLAAVRPEGIAVGVISLMYLAAVRRDALPWVAGPMLLFWTGLTAWRWTLYGALIPNTFAAKASLPLAKLFDVNLTYTHLDGAYWYLPLCALFGLPALCKQRRESLTLAVIGLALIAIAWRVNLWMPGGRLFVPSLALVCCLTAAVAAEGGRWRYGLGIGALGISLALLPTRTHRFVQNYDRVHSVTPNNGAARAARFLGRHAPPDSWLAIRDAGVVAFWVGTDVRVAELHQRALTLPHPDGRDLDIGTHVPPDPTFVVLTQARAKATGVRYPGDRRVFRKLSVPYTYLGRVLQHHHRYYDIYARTDAQIPPFPPKWVVNFDGPAAPVP
jgi:arabinofuranosyltransferase